ncbi:mechanosensitive ion channel family protein [Pistricoccus aurantiacus]|uniref:Small-conductance mechanosensitive channel n=1 Tax=Pistricoccus aurantiacus TaxID=1883414 RepID=A0A5B8SX48_9GAMM|nr:mechanosensitive ion channel family protein [Pistricoccus aurantiacus]QEA40677.1 mechanosensitive ion channel family protein [Pistricoccus aurantiacus]
MPLEAWPLDDIPFFFLLLAEIEQYALGLVSAGPRIAAALLLILLTWGLSKLLRLVVSRIAHHARLRRNLTEVLMMLTGIIVWLVGLLVAMTLLFPSVTPGKALTTLGLGSIAVGFAFKDVFENFLAGLLILIREPFKIGDYIATNERRIEGVVEEITVRDSHIRRTDGQLVVVPNALLFQNPVVVRTDRDVRRTAIMVPVARTENADKTREVLLTAVRQVDSVRDDVRDVQVFAKAFGDSSVDFEIAWWTGSKPVDIRSSRDQVVRAIKRAFDEANIEIPLPHRTLLFREDSPVPLNTPSTSVELQKSEASSSQ